MVKSGNSASGSDEKNHVQNVRHTHGRRMSEEKFNSLSEKDQKRVLRNRHNALQTRKRRKKNIEKLAKENALIKASINLKQRQIAVLSSLLDGEQSIEPSPPQPSSPLPRLDITQEALDMLPKYVY